LPLASVVILGRRVQLMRELSEPTLAAARDLGVNAELRQVESLAEVESVFRALPAGGRGAAMPGNNVPGDTGDIARLALRHRIPTLFRGRDFVAEGGLMSFLLYHENKIERSAALLDKLLRGANPAEIPFELPTKSAFVINRRTAAAIGVVFPADFLLRADEVIG